MEHFFVRLAETAAWAVVVVFIFAAIGFVATIRWFVGLFTKTERAVEGGIDTVERKL